MNANLYAAFDAAMARDPAATALELTDGTIWSFAEVREASARHASLLRSLGLKPGDRVAAQAEKSPQALFAYLGTLRAGGVYLPLNTAYKAGEIAYFLADAEPHVFICDPAKEAALSEAIAGSAVKHVLRLDAAGGGELAEMAARADADAPVEPRRPDDLAAICYTSGTTGRPKGAMLTHRNLTSNAESLVRIWGFVPGDVLLHALPIFHVHGLFVATGCALLNASKMFFLPKFDLAEVIRLLPRSTVMMGIPTFYTRLLDDPRLTADLVKGMRLFVSGSAPLLPDTFRTFRERTGHTILERYGMSEAGMITSNPLEGERRAGSVGFPLPDVEVRVADASGRLLPDGETGVLEIRGPNLFAGYWRKPEQTAKDMRPDGYFITGDNAFVDGDGYINIVGRSKDLVITGGYNVYPKEVETVIDALDGVVESAVFGVPDADFGEAVTAAVVVKPGRADLTAQAIRDAVRAQLAGFKVPKTVRIVPELPRNTMGKVQKAALREEFARPTNRVG